MKINFNNFAFRKHLDDTRETIVSLHDDAQFINNSKASWRGMSDFIIQTASKCINEGLMSYNETLSFAGDLEGLQRGEGVDYLRLRAVCKTHTNNIVELMVARTKKAKNIATRGHVWSFNPHKPKASLPNGFLNHRKFVAPQ